MNYPLRKTMCATCPFLDGSPYENLREMLTQSAIIEASRICHSTGKNNAINKRTGKPPHLCRGVRDVQLKMMFTMKVIDDCTDEAWNEKREQIGLEPTEVKDPS